MVFKVERDKDFFQSNPSASAFEWFPKCSSREAKWVCLVFDYSTPLRNMPMEQRKEVAAKMAGFLIEKETGRLDKNARNVITGRVEKVNKAVEELMEIQYDEEQEMLIAYKEQISQALEILKKKNKSEKEWGICDKLNKSLPGLMKAKQELENTLGFREDRSAGLDSEPLSTLDLLHEES